MKRTLSHSVFFILFVANAFAATTHTVEIKPLVQSSLIGMSDFKSAEVVGEGYKAVLNLKLKTEATQRLKA
jgi:hypothetical protein